MFDDVVDFFTASIVGLLVWFFGGRDGYVNVLIAFIVIDFITGLMVAYAQRKLSSSIGFNGIAKKVAIFCLVGIAHIIDQHVLGGAETIRMTVVLFYVANEGVSIIENVDALGLPIPGFLKDRLLNIKDMTQK